MTTKKNRLSLSSLQNKIANAFKSPTRMNDVTPVTPKSSTYTNAVLPITTPTNVKDNRSSSIIVASPKSNAYFDNDINPLMSPTLPSSLPTSIEGASPFVITAVGGGCNRRLSLPATPTTNRSQSQPRVSPPMGTATDEFDPANRNRTRANSFAMQSLQRTAINTSIKEPVRRSLRQPRAIAKYM